MEGVCWVGVRKQVPVEELEEKSLPLKLECPCARSVFPAMGGDHSICCPGVRTHD